MKDSFGKVTKVTLCNQLKNWCNIDCYAHRKHALKTLGNLKTECKIRNMDSYQKKNELVGLLVPDDQGSSTNSIQSCVNIFQKNIIHDIIMTSCLKLLSLQNNESKQTKLGHNNKKCLVDNLLKDTQLIRSTAGADTCNAHHVGLVTRKTK